MKHFTHHNEYTDTNKLLLSLDWQHSVSTTCKMAGVWYPHVYACLRGEKQIGVYLLMRLGNVFNLDLHLRKNKLVWAKRRSRSKRKIQP